MAEKITVFSIGFLVESHKFSGIGKIERIDQTTQSAYVCFFDSPNKPTVRCETFFLIDLKVTRLYPEQVVYFLHPEHMHWQRGRYIGLLPSQQHLVMIRDGQRISIAIEDIFTLNQHDVWIDVLGFLAEQSNDAPFFYQLRAPFLNAYLSQQHIYQSISAIPSSSVSLEAHQLAVVRRVLHDPTPKYLLADEVGLGKTIEAGFLIREWMLEHQHDARILVVVPPSLLGQWQAELDYRFHLEGIVSALPESYGVWLTTPVEVGAQALSWQPNLVVIDEAHQIAPSAWPVPDNTYTALAQLCHLATGLLLLSGTPLQGGDKHLLSLLHLLNPNAYPLALDDHFQFKLDQREWIEGIFSGLNVEHHNSAVEAILDRLENQLEHDTQLRHLITQLRPHVDWLAEDHTSERQQGILILRDYVAEHYRINHRILRNRRDNPLLQHLFPRLSGCHYYEWMRGAEDTVTVLEELRVQSLDDETLSAEHYAQLIKALLISPMAYADQVQQLPIDQAILDQLLKHAHADQVAKDDALLHYLKPWLRKNAKGKVVVFCGTPKVADHVYELLHQYYGAQVERHDPTQPLRWLMLEQPTQILVCDNRAEDGLNLHGGRRLALHYAIETQISRWEQRLGRFNRYSAHLTDGVIDHAVLLPEGDQIFRSWMTVLDDALQLFKQSVASVQYVLDHYCQSCWDDLWKTGTPAFEQLCQEITGEHGVLQQERRRVRTQEQLMDMDGDIISARQFVQRLVDAEELVEQHSQAMLDWMTTGLRFVRESKTPDLFRLKFVADHTAQQGAGTLVDLKTLIRECLLGFESHATTAWLSLNRDECISQPQVHPLRYGQPFVDALYRMARMDARGAVSAFVRWLPRPQFRQNPEPFFQFTWLSSAVPMNAGLHLQRQVAEEYPALLRSHWLKRDSSLVDNPLTQALLEYPFQRQNQTRTYEIQGHAVQFVDENLRPERWSSLSPFWSDSEWRDLVLQLGHISQQLVHTVERPYQVLVSVQVVIFRDLSERVDDL